MNAKSALCSGLLLTALVAAGPVVGASQTNLTVAVRWNSTDDEPQGLKIVQAAAARFEAAHPGVDVTVLTNQREAQFTAQSLAGTPPDIFMDTVDSILALARNNFFLPLETLAKQSNADLDSFLPATLTSATLGGHLYAMPTDWGATAMAYNIQMFDSAGLAQPNGDLTWDSWLADGRKLTRDTNGDGTPDVWAFQNISDWGPSRIFSSGGYYVSPDLKRWGGNDPATIGALQYLSNLTNVYHITPKPSEAKAAGAQGGQGFNNWLAGGKFAMADVGPWDMGDMKNAKFEWNLVESPRDPKTNLRGSRFQSEAWGIAQKSQHPELAWQLLMEITSATSESQFGLAGVGIPSRREAALNAFANQGGTHDYGAFVRASAYTRFTYYFLLPSKDQAALNNAYKSVMDGLISPEQAMGQLTPEMEAALQKL